MKKTILTLAVLTITAFSLNAHAQKLTDKDLKPITKTLYEGEAITGLKIVGRFNVEIKHGNTTKAVITASEFLYEDLEIALSNDKLKISIIGSENRSVNKLFDKYKNDIVRDLVITTPNFDYLIVNGITNIEFISEFTCENLTLKLNGISKMNGARFKVSGKATVESKGMSHISNSEITGANTLTAESSEMSHLNLKAVNTKSVDIECSGMSHMKINLDKVGAVEANCSGMSHINLNGNCKTINTNASGMSKISSDLHKNK